MNMSELTARLLAAKGDAAVSPEEVLQLASAEVRKALQAGQAVDILGLVRVRLTADGLAGRETGARAIFAEPLPGLLPRPGVVEKSDVVVVIAVEKTDKFSEILAKRLQCPGRQAYVAEGLEGVSAVVKKHGADVVIMDSNLESGDEIRQWLKATPERSLISLIVVYQKAENPTVLNRFRICEDEYLVEPYEMQTLEALIHGEIRRISMERKYFRHEVSFQFPTQHRFIEQAGAFLEQVAAHSGLDEQGQLGLVVAVREAIDNAARHGNRSRHEALVSVAYVLDREKVTVTVEDEGEGFDTSRYLEQRVSGDAVAVARARHKEGRQGGLGIMLMLRSVDRLEYNREGNMIKLTKLLPRKAAVA